MNEILGTEEIPVFLINGFLEAGKSSFISYTLGEDYFHIKGRSLLIVCEDGEVGYRKTLLKRENVVRLDVEEKSRLTKAFLSELTDTYKPERVIIEYNGMWGDPGEIEMPDDWVMYQQLTIMDGSTLGAYLANMKPLMGPMLKNSELCIVNRCDGIDESVLLDYKRKLRPMLLNGSTVVMENKYGEIELETLDEELPYDVKADPVVINDDDYGIWLMDARDYPGRYEGKTLSFKAQVMKSDRLGRNEFVPYRMVMTCCEADMQPLGFIASYGGIGAYANGDWVRVLAGFSVQERDEYHGTGPYLEVKELTEAEPASGPAGF